MQHVVCTGNIDREQYDELRALAPTVHVVAGDFDIGSPWPETSTLQVGQFRIGVIHGHQLLPSGGNNEAALARMRRKLNVDILVSGHTHQNQVLCHDGYYHINPVSTIYATTVVLAVAVLYCAIFIGGLATIHLAHLNYPYYSTGISD